MSSPDPRYITTPAGYEFCRDCGSLVMFGYEEEHDRLHPAFTCSQLGCGVHHFDPHRWEEIYPRKNDTRAAS